MMLAVADSFRDIALAAPAAFLVGVIVGFFVRSKWRLVKRDDDSSPTE